jgi:hypothetical protein
LNNTFPIFWRASLRQSPEKWRSQQRKGRFIALAEIDRTAAPLKALIEHFLKGPRKHVGKSAGVLTKLLNDKI